MRFIILTATASVLFLWTLTCFPANVEKSIIKPVKIGNVEMVGDKILISGTATPNTKLRIIIK
jgi:hypothetical protein